MKLLDLTAEFVGRMNAFIARASADPSAHRDKVSLLVQRVAALKESLKSAEGDILLLLSKLETPPRKDCEVVYVQENGLLRAVVCRDIEKPEIARLESRDHECLCSHVEIGPFGPPKGYAMVEDERVLSEIDKGLDYVCLEVFDHDYRSFLGFTCWLSIYTSAGFLYIVDAVKLRDSLQSLRLFGCGVTKIIHCRACVERITQDFGSMGCYYNYDADNPEIFVDWRIRPLNDCLINLITQSIFQVVEKANRRMHLETHRPEYQSEYIEFAEKYSTEASPDLVCELLKMRKYLAEKYDEGLQYLLSDAQLLRIIERAPGTVDEFDAVLDRMSSVVRLHASDFLLVLRKAAKTKRLGHDSAAQGQPPGGPSQDDGSVSNDADDSQDDADSRFQCFEELDAQSSNIENGTAESQRHCS